MYNPRKINLYIKNELPKISQKGGAINTTLINNKINKYLCTDNKIETFINGASKIEEDIHLWFEFENEIMHDDKDNSNLSYNDKTNNSISFSIKKLHHYSNVSIKDMPTHHLCLKLIEPKYKTIEEFIDEWKKNKKLLQHNIPNIYMYGSLFTNDNIFICNYYITKKYKNHKDLLILEYSHIIKYIADMLLFIDKCRENNIILRNFKFSSIGYEFVDMKINFILIDYNDTSLLYKNDKFFEKYADGCVASCSGILTPYFIIYDYFEMNTEWFNKLNKLYTVGLAEIFIFLLYQQDDIMEKLLKKLYYPSYLKSCHHYYHYMKLFDDGNNKDFKHLISSLNPKFLEVKSQNISSMFLRIIFNCFEKSFDNIKTPIDYLEHINKIYKEYNQQLASIKTQIQPIKDSTISANLLTVKQKSIDEKTLDDLDLESSLMKEEIK